MKKENKQNNQTAGNTICKTTVKSAVISAEFP